MDRKSPGVGTKVAVAPDSSRFAIRRRANGARDARAASRTDSNFCAARHGWCSDPADGSIRNQMNRPRPMRRSARQQRLVPTAPSSRKRLATSRVDAPVQCRPNELTRRRSGEPPPANRRRRRRTALIDIVHLPSRLPVTPMIGRLRFSDAIKDVVKNYVANGQRSKLHLESRIEHHLESHFVADARRPFTTSDVRAYIAAPSGNRSGATRLRPRKAGRLDHTRAGGTPTGLEWCDQSRVNDLEARFFHLPCRPGSSL
jgi:hypothetical protein